MIFLANPALYYNKGRLSLKSIFSVNNLKTVVLELIVLETLIVSGVCIFITDILIKINILLIVKHKIIPS